jgi:hypothetical protein
MSKAKLKGTASVDPVIVGSASRRGFKFALQRLTQPAVRLHRYRNVRTRMLQDALCDLDCGR